MEEKVPGYFLFGLDAISIPVLLLQKRGAPGEVSYLKAFAASHMASSCPCYFARWPWIGYILLTENSEYSFVRIHFP